MTLADSYRQARHAVRAEPPTGLDAALHYIVGVCRRNWLITRRLSKQAKAVLDRADKLRTLSDTELLQMRGVLQTRYRRKPPQRAEAVVEALSYVVEAADRALGKRPYKVQLMGALAIHQGYAAQMATGEGKTLAVCLPAILAAWTGRPCHVVTANDYLAARDAEQMRPLYALCGVTVGHVIGAFEPPVRRQNYACDVVYATSKEFAADFLRDRIGRNGIMDPDRLLVHQLASGEAGPLPVMRGLHTAIIDEADSVLIDEAAVPLLISFPGKNNVLKEASLAASRLVQMLVPGFDSTVDEARRSVDWTRLGQNRLDALTESLPSLWRSPNRREELLQQAVLARTFYIRDRHYVVRDNKIIIVDELTGRLMEGRSWSYGLHQAVEAKEGVPISEPSETYARLSFQRFFQLYQHLGGLSGTFQGIGSELWRTYRLPLVRIPTRLPLKRRMLQTRLFADAEARWAAVEADIIKVRETGRPVLVGTRSIVASETLARRLRDRGIPCAVLNALHAAQEADIIKDAGQAGRVTIATNMAGRGTDIHLGTGVPEIGGLHVIATEFHESRRVDWQLYGRCARQGQAGSTRSLLSLEDEIPNRYLLPSLRRVLQSLCRYPFGERVGLGTYRILQIYAEILALVQRRRLMQTDNKLDEVLSFHTE